MITIKDYAQRCGISYEAARKQVRRYQADLADHIQTIDRATWLDDEAIAFLDERRRKNPIIVEQAADRAELERLQAENAALRDQVIRLQAALIDEKSRSAALLQEKAAYLAEKATPEPPRPWWRRIFGGK